MLPVMGMYNDPGNHMIKNGRVEDKNMLLIVLLSRRFFLTISQGLRRAL